MRSDVRNLQIQLEKIEDEYDWAATFLDFYLCGQLLELREEVLKKLQELTSDRDLGHEL